MTIPQREHVELQLQWTKLEARTGQEMVLPVYKQTNKESKKEHFNIIPPQDQNKSDIILSSGCSTPPHPTSTQVTLQS